MRTLQAHVRIGGDEQMSYHVVQHSFDELPETIIVREDGYLYAYKNDGEPIVDYVYVRERAEDIRMQAIADELNTKLWDGKAKDLLLRTFGLAQMMHDCWLEECKAGDNVDVSACNAYSYELDQIAQAMFDMGIDPNGSDYYRSTELGSGTCNLHYDAVVKAATQ